MLESFAGNVFEYLKLTPEEQESRGILGRLMGVIADTVNPTRNGRRYSEELWDKVFQDPIMKEKIANKCVFGEIAHPLDGREEIDPEKIAVCLAEVPKKNNKGLLIGIFDVLNTPCGKILKTMLDYGTTVGVSSRGSGDTFTDSNGQETVDPDTYECTGWDVVFVPAVKEARMQVVTESLNSTNKKSLSESLTELVANAQEKDRKIMTEAIQNINLMERLKENTVEVIYLNADGEQKVTHFKCDKEYSNTDNEALKNAILASDRDIKEIIAINESIEESLNESSEKQFFVRVCREGACEKREFSSEDAAIDYAYELSEAEGVTCVQAAEIHPNGTGTLLTWTPEGEWSEEQLTADSCKGIFTEDADDQQNVQEDPVDPEVETDDEEQIVRNENPFDYPSHVKYAVEKNFRGAGDYKIDYHRRVKDVHCNTKKDLADSIVDVFGDGAWDVHNVEMHKIVDEDLAIQNCINNMNEDLVNKSDTWSQQDIVNVSRILRESGFSGFNEFKNLFEQWKSNSNTSSEVGNAESDVDIINELKESISRNHELESTVISLQEKLSVCYAKEAKNKETTDKLNESVEKASKQAARIDGLRAKVQNLHEQLTESKTQIEECTATITNLQQSQNSMQEFSQQLTEEYNAKLKAKNVKIKDLQKSVNELSNKITKLNESITLVNTKAEATRAQLTEKLQKSNSLVEKYKKVANKAVDKYISSQALKLGASVDEVKNRLPENYTFDDIDRVCEDLQTYKLGITRLPFRTSQQSLTESAAKVEVRTPSRDSILPADKFEGVDDVDDNLLALAGLI